MSQLRPFDSPKAPVAYVFSVDGETNDKYKGNNSHVSASEMSDGVLASQRSLLRNLGRSEARGHDASESQWSGVSPMHEMGKSSRPAFGGEKPGTLPRAFGLAAPQKADLSLPRSVNTYITQGTLPHQAKGKARYMYYSLRSCICLAVLLLLGIVAVFGASLVAEATESESDASPTSFPTTSTPTTTPTSAPSPLPSTSPIIRPTTSPSLSPTVNFESICNSISDQLNDGGDRQNAFCVSSTSFVRCIDASIELFNGEEVRSCADSNGINSCPCPLNVVVQDSFPCDEDDTDGSVDCIELPTNS